MQTPITAAVHARAATLVAAFAANDESAYFAHFAPESTFIFHTDKEVFSSRDAWLTAWRKLQQDGWRVSACQSSEQNVQVFPGGAVFTHTVTTTAGTPTEQSTYTERETIIFQLKADTLVAIHEHLSALPA